MMRIVTFLGSCWGPAIEGNYDLGTRFRALGLGVQGHLEGFAPYWVLVRMEKNRDYYISARLGFRA